MIEKLEGLPDGVAGFVCHGQVTRQDYTDVLVPVLEQLLRTHDKVRLYYEISPDFTGFDPGAMWEDAKIGIGHLSKWGRVAVVTELEWMRRSVGFLMALMPGETRVFPLAEASAARAWIAAD